jgi:hypothetical protein
LRDDLASDRIGVKMFAIRGLAKINSVPTRPSAFDRRHHRQDHGRYRRRQASTDT